MLKVNEWAYHPDIHIQANLIIYSFNALHFIKLKQILHIYSLPPSVTLDSFHLIISEYSHLLSSSTICLLVCITIYFQQILNVFHCGMKPCNQQHTPKLLLVMVTLPTIKRDVFKNESQVRIGLLQLVELFSSFSILK